jgi:uncharacterized protein (TIGR03435 family)
MLGPLDEKAEQNLHVEPLVSAHMTRGLIVYVLLSAVTFAQAQPEFEVASIRRSSEQVTQVNVGLRITGTQVRISFMSIKDYIGMAYSVRPNQISGPDWLAQQRFDIVATIPAGVSPAQVPAMLQALLADRFQMKVHRESKEFPVYALTVAKGGLKIREVPPGPDAAAGPPGVNVAATGTGAGVAVNMGGGSSFALGNNKLEARKMTMTAFADVLTRFVDRPVVDMTGLKGVYDLTLELSPDDYTATLVRSAVNQGVVLPPQALRVLETASADPFSAPLRQVGLALDSRKAPLDVIVVDAALKTPTEN